MKPDITRPSLILGTDEILRLQEEPEKLCLLRPHNIFEQDKTYPVAESLAFKMGIGTVYSADKTKVSVPYTKAGTLDKQIPASEMPNFATRYLLRCEDIQLIRMDEVDFLKYGIANQYQFVNWWTFKYRYVRAFSPSVHIIEATLIEID